MKVLVLFDSVNETLKMEDLLESSNIEFRSVVKPRTLGTDCGVALKVDHSDIKNILHVADDNGCHVVGVFKKENNHWMKMEQESGE